MCLRSLSRKKEERVWGSKKGTVLICKASIRRDDSPHHPRL
jgi:hypothetical protein